MSVNWGLEIITDGLVLALDAGGFRSYSGSGTTWYDLSINKNHATMVNSPTYTGNSMGTIIFDGVNDYVDFYAENLTSVASVEIWMKLGTSYSNKMPFGWNMYDVWCPGGALGYNTFNSDLYGLTSNDVTSLGLVNNWHHYIFEMRSDISYTSNKIYIDTINQSLSQVSGVENTSNRTFNYGYGRISSVRNGSSYLIPMEVGIFKVYNKILTQNEIEFNYNTIRKRYNI